MNLMIKNKKSARKSVRVSIIVLEIIVLLATTIFAWAYIKYGSMNLKKLNLKKVDMNNINEEVYTGYTSVALFGLDSRDTEIERGNSDTIIVMAINNETNEIKMLSVYRDTYVSMGTSYSGYSKANAAYGNGGPEEALSMLNTNLDLNLRDYITTNWAALVNAIDMMGGLDLNMTSEEVYWMNGYQLETAKSCNKTNEVFDLPLTDGVQHVNGVQATAFCRIRYTKGDDFKRTERQRYVIEQILKKAKTLKLNKLNKIANKVFPMISTNMKFSQLLKLGTRLLKFKIKNTYGFPYTKSTGNAGNKGSCVFCDDLVGDVARLHKDLYNEKDYQPSSVVQNLSSVICKSAAASANTDSGSGSGYSSDESYYDDSYNQETYDEGSADYSDNSYTEDTSGDSTDSNAEYTE